VPKAVHRVLETLRGAGHEAHLVGGCVRGLIQGSPVEDFDVTTSARPPELLALFPRAIPIGLRHGTVMVPTGIRPVDVTCHRAGAGLESDLAHRDFTINAIAWDPDSDSVLDPFGGVHDLEARVLRCVGSCSERLAEDPLRAVRAARFVATLDLELEPGLRAALPEARARLAEVAPQRIRNELERLLLGRAAGRGLAVLRRAGLETALAPGVRRDAGVVVDAMPRRIELRLAAWLRNTRAGRVLAKLRFPRSITDLVTELLSHHPIDVEQWPPAEPRLRRLLARLSEDGIEALLALREAELQTTSIDGGVQERLQELRAALARARDHERMALSRQGLALDGRDIMRLFGWEAGPRVGQALRHLTECVLDDPDCNTEEALEALLRRWDADS
jgi:tRNA nucleotidyltransferase (CCA-adding enzyme)